MSVAALTGMIPIVVAGGLVLKFTEAGMPRYERAKRQRAVKKAYRKGYPMDTPRMMGGNFSNVGF